MLARMPRPRFTLALGALASAALLLVLLAPAALAAAGGGSSGFGGGGGGGGYSGGGGGGYGGSGSGSSGPGDVVIGVLFLLGLIIFILWWIYRQAVNAYVRERLRRRRRARVKRVVTASAEAAEDDPAFHAETVGQSAEQLFRMIQV